MKERITLDMSVHDTLIALCDGNPGALNVLLQLIQHAPAIDPQAALGPWAVLLALDAHGIYGSRIWMLYKDVYRQDIGRVVGFLRAVQLGRIGESRLNALIDGHELITADAVDAIVAGVRAELSQFNPAARAGALAQAEAVRDATGQ